MSTGTLPAVPVDDRHHREHCRGSGQRLLQKTQIAIENAQKGKALTQKDFRFHFFPWWQEPAYRIATPVDMTDKEREYFATVEGATGTVLDAEQRNWYISTRDSDFSGDPEKMWQEYPSTAAEAFQVSTEGTYYATQLAKARKEGRITNVPHIPSLPVNTFWDIGNTDGTAIWFHQRLGYEDRWINFMEGWGESYSHYTSEMQKLGYTWGTHCLPYDADQKRRASSPTRPKPGELLPGCDFESCRV